LLPPFSALWAAGRRVQAGQLPPDRRLLDVPPYFARGRDANLSNPTAAHRVQPDEANRPAVRLDHDQPGAGPLHGAHLGDELLVKQRANRQNTLGWALLLSLNSARKVAPSISALRRSWRSGVRASPGLRRTRGQAATTAPTDVPTSSSEPAGS